MSRRPKPGCARRRGLGTDWPRSRRADNERTLHGGLDRKASRPDDVQVIIARRTTRREHRGVSALLVVALLLFAHTCAVLGGMACAAPSSASGEDHHATTAGDVGCGDHDGDCSDPGDGDGTHGACSHGAICCSTWAPAPATFSVVPPPATPLALATGIPQLRPSVASAARPAPIPAESPPPLISALRL
jgi:hypothetical protein